MKAQKGFLLFNNISKIIQLVIISENYFHAREIRNKCFSKKIKSNTITTCYSTVCTMLVSWFSYIMSVTLSYITSVYTALYHISLRGGDVEGSEYCAIRCEEHCCGEPFCLRDCDWYRHCGCHRFCFRAFCWRCWHREHNFPYIYNIDTDNRWFRLNQFRHNITRYITIQCAQYFLLFLSYYYTSYLPLNNKHFLKAHILHQHRSHQCTPTHLVPLQLQQRV